MDAGAGDDARNSVTEKASAAAVSKETLQAAEGNVVSHTPTPSGQVANSREGSAELRNDVPSDDHASAQFADALGRGDIEELRTLSLGLIAENRRLQKELHKHDGNMASCSSHGAGRRAGEVEAEVDTLVERLKCSEGVGQVDLDDGNLRQQVRTLQSRLEREQRRMQEELFEKESGCQQLHTALARVDGLLRRLPTPLQPAENTSKQGAARTPSPAMSAAVASLAPTPRRQDRLSGDARPLTMRLTVDLTPSNLASKGREVLMQVRRSDTATDVKRRLANAGLSWGPPGMSVEDGVKEARLLQRGMPLKSDVPLTSLGVGDGSRLRLVPAMCRVSLRSRDGFAGSAPRGLLMNPGSKPWEPTQVRNGELAHSEDLAHRGLAEHVLVMSVAKRGMAKPVYPAA